MCMQPVYIPRSTVPRVDEMQRNMSEMSLGWGVTEGHVDSQTLGNSK